MTIPEAIEVLELHNKWRRGSEIPMERPVRIGVAIEIAIRELRLKHRELKIKMIEDQNGNGKVYSEDKALPDRDGNGPLCGGNCLNF